MPLYSNILSSRKNEAKSNDNAIKSSSNASMKLLQDHLLAKQRSKQQNILQKKQQDKSNNLKSSQIVSESVLHRPKENDWDPEDEYDPMVPNSYEVLQAEYLKSEEFRLANQRATSSNKKIIPNILDVLDNLDSDEEYDTSSAKKNKGTAIAPPPSLLSTTGDLEKSDFTKSNKLPPAGSQTLERQDGSSVAAKIMSKMGYKLGQGLGKDEQGISSPLEVEKSGLNSGRILPANKPNQKTNLESTQLDIIKQNEDKKLELLRGATRVLLLHNMVGPGEVDDDLEAETKEECKKYGHVIKCLIYEIPDKRVPDEEAVRIFVEFRDEESAVKASNDLNGRYFGGRIVRASFYNVDKFNKYELGP